MSEYLAPGVYIDEVPFGSHAIDGVSTDAAGFVGVSRTPQASSSITSFADFERTAAPDSSVYLSSAVRGFFDNGGRRCSVAWIGATDPVEAALEALFREPVSLLCCPDAQALPAAAGVMVAACEQTKRCFCILSSPAPTMPVGDIAPPVHSSYAAWYHPWLTIAGPIGALTIPPCGHVAGAYARSDAAGVWKPLGGTTVSGASAVSQDIQPSDAGLLASRGVDVLQFDPQRGIRISAGITTSTDVEWKYVNLRRLLVFVESSIDRGLQWAVFEPNDLTLWERVRAAIGAFAFGLWKSGALVGQTANEAFFVRCDRTTMTQDDIDNNRLVAIVGVAPVRPAEFVILRVTCQSSRPGDATAT